MLKGPPLWRLTFGLLLIVFWSGLIVQHTRAQDLLTLTVDPGYDSYFREDAWIPLRIEVGNDGDDIVGRLVVRPETSGSAVPNTFSSPISLPSGSRKTAFLYITARSFAQRIRVELLGENNLVHADTEVTLRHVQPADQLYVVVSESPTGSVDMSSVAVGGYRAFQANWRLANLPGRAAALDAVDLMLLSEVDTGALSAEQAQAIVDWVAGGGHLVVTGGANWQPTAAGLHDLLPLIPDSSATVENLNALAALASRSRLPGQTVVATGQLAPDAVILAASEDGLPLLARRRYGSGTVDYLAAEPSIQPLRLWDGLDSLWYTLLTSVSPNPTWTEGFGDWNSAIDAIEILPGVNLLPAVLALCGFLGLYILLIGPVNYLILNRLNRREWAWISIPSLIILFSALAWIFGFNLRGTDVTLSRLTVVQSWPQTERARVDQLVGLLSPLRANYTLAVPDDRLLRPISRTSVGGILGGSGAQTNTNISQTDTFKAVDFPVDASFIASFAATGYMPKPDIRGQVTLAFQADGALLRVRGSVRNDSDQALSSPVILARGLALPLEGPLEPGDLKTFENEIVGEMVPQPAALEPDFDLGATAFGVRYASRFDREISVRDIIGPELYEMVTRSSGFTDDVEMQETIRRQHFLKSFIADRFNSTGRGDRVYLAGWVEGAPSGFEVEGANWTSKDTTLYIIELDLQFERPPASQEIMLSADQFTWMTQERIGVSNYTGPFSIRLSPGEEVVFRFTPLPELVMSEVDQVMILANRGSTFIRQVAVQLWNWRAQTWEEIEFEGTELIINNPAAYIGPQNAMQMRLTLEATGGFLDFGNVAVAQRGRF